MSRFRAALIVQLFFLLPFFLSVVCRILFPSLAEIAVVRFFLNHKMSLFCIFSILTLIDAAYLKRAWIVRHKNEIGAIAGMTFLSTLLLLMSGVSHGHDLPFHLMRIEGMVDAIKGGQFPVRIQPLWFDGYGYPVSIYYGDLFLLFPAILRLFNVPLGAAYELYIFFVTALTASVSYICFARILGNRTAGTLSALVYVSSTYRLVDVFTRSAVGEYTAFIFFPIIALAMFRIYTKSNKMLRNAVILAVGMSALLMTHLLSTELVALTLVSVCLILWKKTFSKKVILQFLLAAMLTALFCAAFIMPFLDYTKNVPVLVQTGGLKHIQERGAHIVELFSFFSQPQGRWGGKINERMSSTPGFLLMGAFVLSAAFLIYRKKDKTLLLFWVLSLITLCLSTNLFPYDMLEKMKAGKLLAQIQFPCRWLTISTVVLSLALGRLFIIYQKVTPPRVLHTLSARFLCAGILSLSVIQTTYFTSAFVKGSNNQVINDYSTFGTSPGHGNEYVRVGTDLKKRDGAIATSGISVLSSNRCGTTFTVEAKSDNGGFMDLPLFNYKGYRATSDGNVRLPISDGENNTVRVQIPSEFDGTITVAFVPPLLWRISEIISLVSITVVIVFFVRHRKSNM